MKKPEDLLPIHAGFLTLGDNNSTSFLVMGQDGSDLVLTDIYVHRHILGREIGTKTDDDPLNVFRYGLSLRHIDHGTS